MKKSRLYIAAALAIALAGCKDDEFIDTGIPVETGDEIMFGSTLNSDYSMVDTRTVYGERTETGIPVYWEPNGTDEIAIFCPQASAPASHLVNYKIYTDGDEQADASKVVKVDPESAGLQWGSTDEHKFFALYPASIVHSSEADDQSGKITGYLPTLQKPTGWRKTIDPNTRNYVYRAEPNMDYAFMFAYSKVKKSAMTTQKNIDLKFQNLVTVLDLTIPGPTSGSVTVTNINVDVVDGAETDICGYFYMDIDDADVSGHVDCYPDDEKNNTVVTNRISIPCYGDVDGDGKQKYVTLNSGESINVKAYVIPDTERQEEFRNFKITVSTLNGAAQSIALENPTGGAAIAPHKISRILLPNLTTVDSPDNWMSNLDDNIYLTELSIPGSKMSYLTTENGANPVYQNKTIQEQLDDGVRAFIVQTGSQTTYTEHRSGSLGNYKYSYTHKSTSMSVFGAAEGTTLENTLAVIQKGLEAAPTECAFLILTCEGNHVKPHEYEKDYSSIGGGHRGDGVASDGWQQRWIEAVEYKLHELKSTYPIYDKEITANTTLGDVRGKIIIKVNYNETKQENYIEANADIPALFGLWKTPSDSDLAPASDLYWGTPNSSTSRQRMYWLCQEATNVGTSAEITVENKKAAIVELFRKNVVAYKEREQHDVWFMNDIGGVYASDNSTTRLATDMNTIAVDNLQTRTENAATGLVFVNFADRDSNSGGLYKSDYIITTIIDNNFKFALRKRSSSTPSGR